MYRFDLRRPSGVALCAALVGITLLGLPAPSWGWISGPEGPTFGPDEAQREPPWGAYPNQSPLNEHALLLALSMRRAGIPSVMEAVYRTPVYVGKDQRAPGSANPSVFPKAFSGFGSDVANAKAERSYTIPGFASLPDHAYSIGDWAAGNEVCPPGTWFDTSLGIDARVQSCHQFSFHLGLLNSTHFVPQSEHTYGWYHSLALRRADDCKRFGASVIAARMRFEKAGEMVMECEREALLLEATGQHFLQDAWAVGHMWERWGVPTFQQFPLYPLVDAFQSAFLVGLVSGLVHGAEGLLGIPDEMSAGNIDTVRWSSPALSVYGAPGIGDVHLDSLLNDSRYAVQQEALLSCAAGGLSEVYGRTSQFSGSASPIGATRESTGPACWAQRATNAAILEGFGVSCPPGSTQSGCALNDPAVKLQLAGSLLPVLTGSLLIPSSTLSDFRSGMILLTVNTQLYGRLFPNGTDLANSGIADQFMSVLRNGLADTTTPPAPYAEPNLPWTPVGTATADTWSPASWISRVFNGAHVKEWCDAAETSPTNLIERVVAASDDDRPIACEICTEFVSRREQTDDKPSICTVAGASAPSLIAPAGRSAKQAAQRYCRCGHWDAAADFAPKNPNDDWSYGWIKDPITGPFGIRPYSFQGQYSGIDILFDPLGSFNGTPNVSHNSLSTTVSTISGQPWETGPLTNISFAPKELAFHPGRVVTEAGVRVAPRSAVRWTAPFAGTYRIKASMGPLDKFWTGVGIVGTLTTGGRLLSLLDLTLLPGAGLQTGQKVSYVFDPVQLAEGEQVDFVVSAGPNDDYTFDTTGINVIVDLVAPVSP